MLAQGKTPKVAADTGNSVSRLSALSKGDCGKPQRNQTRKGNFLRNNNGSFCMGQA